MNTQETTRLEKMKAFYATLSCDIDLPYFADADHESFEELRDSIEDGGGFDVEIIYYSRAMEYLANNDNSLRESLGLASEMGYDPKDLNSEILASLLASQNARAEFEDLGGKISDFFDELNEERDNEEAEEEQEEETND
jgi:hypothetical protein